MEPDIRELKSTEELEQCIALQRAVWGLNELGLMSPITLKALTLEAVHVGLVLGAYVREHLVGMAIVLGCMEQGVAYGHMLGVLEEYRDAGIGRSLHQCVARRLVAQGVRELVWTFEPLESRNAHVYINRAGARMVAYQEACFHVQCDMHAGLPLDRLLARAPLEWHGAATPLLSYVEACRRYPVVTTRRMPDADGVLVHIPGDLAGLKARDMDEARRYRLETRIVFNEYLNRRGYQGTGFISEQTQQGRVSCYLLTRKHA